MINGPSDFRASQLGIKGSRSLHSLCISCLVPSMMHDCVLCAACCVKNIHGKMYMEKEEH